VDATLRAVGGASRRLLPIAGRSQLHSKCSTGIGVADEKTLSLVETCLRQCSANLFELGLQRWALVSAYSILG
jgi:hypothetical protein